MYPKYQRQGRLWSTSDKAFLIDSILNGFDIPKLYVADFNYGNSPLNQSQLPYAIIDGKQRLEAIFDFFSGDLVLNNQFKYLANPDLKLGGLGLNDLRQNHASIAEEFDNYNLSVMSVITDSEELIDDLFVRLNRSKPLTGAEIRNAMSGPVPKLIRRLAKHEFFKSIVRFNTKRGQDKNAAAKILLFEWSNGPKETKKRNLDAFVSREFTDPSDAQHLELSARRATEVLDRMSEVFLPRDQLLASAGVTPVYYWLIRNMDLPEDLPKTRQFLVDFERQRLENRRLINDNPSSKNIVNELVEYDNYSRSTNDQKSHERRFEILWDWFLG